MANHPLIQRRIYPTIKLIRASTSHPNNTPGEAPIQPGLDLDFCLLFGGPPNYRIIEIVITLKMFFKKAHKAALYRLFIIYFSARGAVKLFSIIHATAQPFRNTKQERKSRSGMQAALSMHRPPERAAQ